MTTSGVVSMMATNSNTVSHVKAFQWKCYGSKALTFLTPSCEKHFK
jgi:hypothetical protein